MNSAMCAWVSEWVVLRPAQHIIGHFGDKFSQAITYTGTDNTKQREENTPKTHRKPLTKPKLLAVRSG